MPQCTQPGCAVAALAGGERCSDHALVGSKSVPARRRSTATKLPSQGVGPRIPSGALGRAIVALLRSDPSRTYSPDEIAKAIGAARKSVGKELCRLITVGKNDSPPPVQRTGQGLYGCFLGPRDLHLIESPMPKVHALQLVWKLPPGGGSAPRSRARTHARGRLAEAAWGELNAQGAWIHDDGSRSFRRITTHNDHKATLQVFPTTGTLLVSLSTTQKPLDPAGLQAIRAWLQGMFDGEGWPWYEPRVATVEINRDFKRIRLAGRDAVTFFLGRMAVNGERNLNLQALEGALYKLYNKKDLGVLREEIRLHPRELDLSNLQALVTTLFYGPLGQPPPPSVPAPILDAHEGGYT